MINLFFNLETESPSFFSRLTTAFLIEKIFIKISQNLPNNLCWLTCGLLNLLQLCHTVTPVSVYGKDYQTRLRTSNYP